MYFFTASSSWLEDLTDWIGMIKIVVALFFGSGVFFVCVFCVVCVWESESYVVGGGGWDSSFRGSEQLPVRLVRESLKESHLDLIPVSSVLPWGEELIGVSVVLPRIFLLPRVASGGRTLVLVVLLVEPHKIQLLLTYFSVFYISDT